MLMKNYLVGIKMDPNNKNLTRTSVEGMLVILMFLLAILLVSYIFIKRDFGWVNEWFFWMLIAASVSLTTVSALIGKRSVFLLCTIIFLSATQSIYVFGTPSPLPPGRDAIFECQIYHHDN